MDFGIATAYAKEGCNLVITGRDSKRLEAAKERLEAEHGVEALVMTANVNAGAVNEHDGSLVDNAAFTQAVVDAAIEKFGRIDVLVNGAQGFPADETSVKQDEGCFDLAAYSGLHTTLHYMLACYPHLKETKGSIINFAFSYDLDDEFSQYAYAAAKEGVIGLSRAAAAEWGPDGVNVSVVCSVGGADAPCLRLPES